MNEGDKKYPRITIVLTCFNREKYIAESIESVISQGYPNLECIVIDDNSKDRSWEIIQRYKDRLAYIERLDGHRTTPVPAINHALSKSTGDIMTTLNDKNLLMPKSLFTVAEVFTEFPDIEWITGIGLIADPEGKITNVSPLRKGLHEHLIPVSWNIQHESTFWKRSLWERVGGKFNEASWSFDNDLWSRFFLTTKLYYLNTILGAYRKIATAHGVTKKAEYYHHAAEARNMLRSKIGTKELVYAELYRVLRYLKPLLRNIPDNVYRYIPVLNHFCHDAITFHNVTGERPHLKLYKRNPFRTIFPW
jgi:glycosyltransferase involved in cell wall biosynthesis